MPAMTTQEAINSRFSAISREIALEQFAENFARICRFACERKMEKTLTQCDKYKRVRKAKYNEIDAILTGFADCVYPIALIKIVHYHNAAKNAGNCSRFYVQRDFLAAYRQIFGK